MEEEADDDDDDSPHSAKAHFGSHDVTVQELRRLHLSES